jgi:PAS domain S-box-containing protein
VIKLLETQEMAKFLWESTREGMAVVDRSGRIKTVNPAFSAFLGYSHSELEGRHFGEITFSQDIEADMNEFRDLVEGKISAYEMQKRYITKMGMVVPGRIRVTKFLDQICVFAQVLPIEDAIVPVHVTNEERTRIFEEMIGELVRKHWKKVFGFIFLLIGVAAGIVNFETILAFFGLGVGG